MTDVANDPSAPGQAPTGHITPDPDDAGWIDVCDAALIPLDRGVAMLIGGDQVAVFRLSAEAGGDDGEEWYAVSHVDPATGAPTIARGLVGSSGTPQTPTVAAPLHKQRYDLRSGRCLDDPDLHLRTYAVRIAGDRLHLRP
ncbi:MAG: nitrite reductase small subunit NirD [Actinomycetota bacterium]